MGLTKPMKPVQEPRWHESKQKVMPLAAVAREMAWFLKVLV
uniref:Uncharacterized protein n=1 Tax=Arundo donax TaxID=35708 RepID=A0A0A9EPU2_ARUDO